MRRILLLALLVIVLVSLNWFKVLVAQDFNNLSTIERAELLKKYQTFNSTANNSKKYSTPKIFESGENIIPRETENESDDQSIRENSKTLNEDHENNPISFEDLKPFGIELFASPDESIPPEDIATDDSYRLGPGDNVIVNLWGNVEKNYDITIDRQGAAFIPGVGEVIARGRTVEQFRNDLSNKISKSYTGYDLTVTLGKIRSIRIYLTGEVNRPGAYTVSSLTSLFNALYMAGGPNEFGSMRSIRLMRSGKKIAEVDLYKFLLHGDNSNDIRLESGDAIFVPVASTRVAIRGEIRREAIYELSSDETAENLLKFAGGANPQAHLDRIMLERVADKNQWEVLDLDLSDNDSNNKNMKLFDGDRLTVYSVFQAKKNMVAIFGQVKNPGYYEKNDSTYLSDIIKRGELQEYDVHFERANLFRKHSDWRTEVIPIDLLELKKGSEKDIILFDKDSIHVYAIEDVTFEKHVYIEGEVNNPGQYPYYDRMTVSDLIFLAGSFARGAWKMQAEIASVDQYGEVAIRHVDLNGNQNQNMILKEDDRVYIRQIPQWRRHRTVTIEGEVAHPGEYVLRDENETLLDLLRRSGGFTTKAFPVGTIFERKSVSRALDNFRVINKLNHSSELIQDSLGNITPTAQYNIESESFNRIVINVPEIIESNGFRGNITLSPGDKIYVPSIPSGITVLGAVGHSGTIQFQKDKKVKEFIKRAGNFTRQADKSETLLLKADGEVYSGKSTLGKKVDLGDIIVVPTRIEKERNFGRTLTNILTITTGALTTVLLATKL